MVFFNIMFIIPEIFGKIMSEILYIVKFLLYQAQPDDFRLGS
jgi:hypothetical protein